MTETTGILAKTGDTEMTERYIHNHTMFDPGDTLNQRIQIISDLEDAANGGAAHNYKILVDSELAATIQFQHGARTLPTSTAGVSDAAVLAVALDRLTSFQNGPFACRENENAQKYVALAMQSLAQRSIARRNQGVIGKNLPHITNNSPAYEAWPDMEKSS